MKVSTAPTVYLPTGQGGKLLVTDFPHRFAAFAPEGRQMLRKLKVYAGPEHPHEAQLRGIPGEPNSAKARKRPAGKKAEAPPEAGVETPEAEPVETVDEAPDEVTPEATEAAAEVQGDAVQFKLTPHLKIVEEEIDSREAARQGGVTVGVIDDILYKAARKGLLIAPASRITRAADFPRGVVENKKYFTTPTFTLQWHITQTCDLHCRHCYDRSRRDDVDSYGCCRSHGTDLNQCIYSCCNRRRDERHHPEGDQVPQRP